MKIGAKMLVIAALVGLLAGCTGPNGGSPDFKKDVEQVLRDNPELLLTILDEHKEELFDLVLAGQEHKKRRIQRERWKEELESPATPDMSGDRPVAGNPEGTITIVEYSDFLCPYCSRASQVMAQLLANHEDLRLVFRHNPLDSHAQAYVAAQYFEAAGMQDPQKAWHLHDIMFLQQQQLDEGGEEWIKEQAAKIGLDVAKLAKDAYSEEVQDRIDRDIAEAERYRFDGTPAFMVNGVSVMGALPIQDFEDLISMIKAHEAGRDDAGDDATADTTADAPAEDGPAE